MRAIMSAVMITGALLAGDRRGGDQRIALGHGLGEALGLLGLLLVGEFARVTAAPAAETPVSTNGAQRLDLLARLGSHRQASTMAPIRRAVAIACRPATPAPITSTLAGRMVPAA